MVGGKDQAAGVQGVEGDQLEEDGEPWQEVVVPRESSLRGRDWRIEVETCGVVALGAIENPVVMTPGPAAGGVLALDLELKEVRLRLRVADGW